MATAGPLITPFNADKKHTDIERWVCVYPAYLNAKKTIKEGRKIPKEKAVENPTYLEIRDVLQASNFKIVLENKLYPREKSKVGRNNLPDSPQTIIHILPGTVVPWSDPGPAERQRRPADQR